ncbi:hypothetical protein BFP97_05960 [Roseivirga sp. 4D4]|uniref:hypothetical protein n=1 Tax=Roseivirga sp. 4D4 TaxID=1889784 RepID=UPI000853B7B3|nr:hypothetical protein [Roseivirga sp. 4D4]OEK01079.1 hypothetical protein BFP97_05960 [Roseivirga sp. 4D4]
MMRKTKTRILSLALLVALIFTYSCEDDIDTQSQVIYYKGLKVNHTYSVPADVITNANFSTIINEQTQSIINDAQIRTSNGQSVTYSLEDLSDIAQEEEVFVPNDTWSDTQITAKIYQDFPTINTLQQIEANWEIIGDYYNDVVQYNVTQRLDEVGTINEGPGSPGIYSNPNKNSEKEITDLKSSSSYDGSLTNGLSICEFAYLASRWALANAARRAKSEAKSISKQRWPGTGSDDREDVMRHLAGSWLLGYYYAKGLFQGNIQNVYDKTWAFLYFREEQICSDAADHVREMDHRNNLNGLEHWKNTAYTQTYLWGAIRRVRSGNKSTEMDFLSDVKTFWSTKVAPNSQAVWNVDTWTCVYFVD